MDNNHTFILIDEDNLSLERINSVAKEITFNNFGEEYEFKCIESVKLDLETKYTFEVFIPSH